MALTGKDLLNYVGTPPGFDMISLSGKRAKAYFDMNAYPWFAFHDWKPESDGPLPKVLPTATKIVTQQAIWLFGKPIQINIEANKKAQEAFRQVWDYNDMQTNMVTGAIMGGNEGSIALKFSTNEKKDRVRLDVLSCNAIVKFFTNPHNQDEVLMCRIQYPFWDYKERSWFWYREEWTKELYVVYKPLKTINFGTHGTNPYMFAGSVTKPDDQSNWEVAKTSTNIYGVIPVTRIKNRNTEHEFGAGDVWNHWQLLDRVNLTYHGMDVSNQLDSEPALAVTDGETENQDINRAMRPRSAIVLNTRTRDNAETPIPIKVQLLEPSGKLRPHMKEYVTDLLREIYDSTGSVFVDQKDITNKGKLTQSVLTQTYLPLINTVKEKRKSYGSQGICKFIQNACFGLANAGVEGFSKVKSPDDPSNVVTIDWFDFFEMTAEEMFSFVDRIDTEVQQGYITREIAIKKIAAIEEIEEVDALVTELMDFVPQTEINDGDPQRGSKRRSQQSNTGDVNDAS